MTGYQWLYHCWCLLVCMHACVVFYIEADEGGDFEVSLWNRGGHQEMWFCCSGCLTLDIKLGMKALEKNVKSSTNCGKDVRILS